MFNALGRVKLQRLLMTNTAIINYLVIIVTIVFIIVIALSILIITITVI